MEKTTSDAIAYRRSVRLYKNEDIDSEKVKQCIQNASIATTSSNLQLWKFVQRWGVRCSTRFNQSIGALEEGRRAW